MAETELIFEIKGPEGWHRIGSMAEHATQASISSDNPGGREVYLFGWSKEADGKFGVWRSISGFDIATPLVRELHTEGLESLGDLSEQPVTITYWRGGYSADVRFRLAEIK